MAKQKFDPNIIKQRESAVGLSPTDFMRPFTEIPQPPQPAAPLKPSASQRPATKARQDSDELEMPPEKKVEPRITILFRTSVELDKRLRHFLQVHHSSMQDSCMMAVDEFLKRRGY